MSSIPLSLAQSATVDILKVASQLVVLGLPQIFVIDGKLDSVFSPMPRDF